MKLITPADLVNKTNFQLSALYARLKEELGHTEPGSYKYEILSMSLENVRRAYTTAPKFKPPGM